MANYNTQEISQEIEQAKTTIETVVWYINGGGLVDDTIPPVVDNFDPPGGSTIAKTQALSFTVSDQDYDPEETVSAFSLIMVLVYYPSSGAYEVAFDRDAFAPLYAASSVEEVSISDRSFTLRRSGGWPASPTVRVRVVDKGGNLDG